MCEAELFLQGNVTTVEELRHESGDVVPMVLKVCAMPVVFVYYLIPISF